jgi:mitochondrial inner membrane protease subunit 1
MLPTLNARGDVLLTEYVSPRLELLKPGDVIVATKPNDSKTSVIKRIRGMGGDRIWVRRQGAAVPEEIVVPEGHVWLEGDNPLQSTDSRDYGPVPLGLVRGKIVLRFWPPGQAQMIESRVIDHTQPYRDAIAASRPPRPVSPPPARAVRAPGTMHKASSPTASSGAVAEASSSAPLSRDGNFHESATEGALYARPKSP